MDAGQVTNPHLRARRTLTSIYAFSALVAALMAAASIVGLLCRDTVYPTDDLVKAFLPNDVVNLLIGLPILLISMWLARRGRLLGLLLWPGALFFVLYNYLVYVLAMPFNAAFLLHVALLILSVYTLSALLASIDGGVVQQRLAGSVPEKLAGGILAGLGLLFFLRAAAVMIGALTSSGAMVETEVALNVTDMTIAPALIIGGLLLWRRTEFGYVTGLGLLFQISMLFVGLIIVLLMHPLMTDTPFAPVDVLVVFILGLIGFVPFALFVRGVVSSGRSAHM